MELLFVTSAISLPTNDRVIKDTEELSRKDAPKSLVKGEKVKIWPALKDCRDSIDTNSNAYKAIEAITRITSLRANANAWLSSICFPTPIARCVNLERKDEINDKFIAYENEFKTLVNDFISNFDELVEFWANLCDNKYGHDWGNLVRKYKLTKDKLRASFKFNLLTYSVSSEDGLKVIEDNISDYMYEGLVAYVVKFFGKKGPGDKVQTSALTTFENELVAYLESYAFLDSQLDEIKKKVQAIMQKLWLNHWSTSSKKTMVLTKDHGLWKVKAMLGSPQAIEALKASSQSVKVSFARPKLSVTQPTSPNADPVIVPSREDTKPTQVETIKQPIAETPMNEAMNRLRNSI
ncbi:hypothetical protein VIBNIFTn2_120220 [Vibrio nigripulchritudo FTn2]|uniref:DUF3150 domain-containing protein n=1 Tax=Vibrio nigripulchritudo TaxID=28173 RepID=UPI0003B1ADB5|nr:DUF3150 domain-containing protein [Vibrio nigripulchritudo]CCN40238.1 hypothetical protein VIBNIFTn2_120220 [Vibrio nigripulchritudo FTn2]